MTEGGVRGVSWDSRHRSSYGLRPTDYSLSSSDGFVVQCLSPSSIFGDIIPSDGGEGGRIRLETGGCSP
jgi:hypothetical protein